MRLMAKVAFRNLLRNRKRSLLVIMAVAFGLGSVLFLRGFVSGVQKQMEENITSIITGEVSIFPKSMENLYDTNDSIQDAEKVRRILKGDPHILHFAEEVYGSGIAATANGSVMTFVVGLDPEEERMIGTHFPLVAGRVMEGHEEGMALLGEKMRKMLGLELGEKVVITVQDTSGGLTGESFTLLGTLETGNDQLDSGNVILLRRPAQRLLGLGERISKIVLKLDSKADPHDVVRNLRKQLVGTNLSVMSWEEQIPMLAQMMRFQDGMIFVILMIVLLVATAGILNTLLMSIIERTQEFGLMMALGTRPFQLILLIALESLLLTALGVLLGVMLGLSAILYFGYVGIDLSWFVSALSNFFVGSHVYPQVDGFYLLLFSGIVLGSNGLASLYPAWKASRLVPIEAMRQVG